MANIRVVITVQIPYPKEYSYDIQASSLGTALNRAYARLRKEPLAKGKHIDSIVVKALKNKL